MKKVFALLLCLVLVFSVTGTFVAVEGGEEQYQQEAFSVVEKNLITGEETTKTFETNEIEEALIDNEVINQLPDFGEEMIMPYGIIGDDERQIVEDTSRLPYSAIAYIKIDWPGITTTGGGTAWLISKNVAVTAAHNLYNPETDKWANGIRIYPGKTGFGLWNDPFESTFAIGFGVSSNWDAGEKGNYKYDWGLIILDSPIGEETGVINFRSPILSSEIDNAPIMISGYSDNDSLFYDYKQRKAYGTIIDFTNYELDYTADTEEGGSGSPVLIEDNVAVGIHCYDNSDKGYNYGVRITPEMCNYFNSTISDYA